MNILPKKRWHVLTKENIARVRSDEAKFAEEERQVKYRAQLADQEARVDTLRKRTRHELIPSTSTNSGSLLSDRSSELIEGNKEYETEKKAEQETQEKRIGLLTYLGQSLIESGGEKPWYDVHPKKLLTKAVTNDEKSKIKEEWEAKKKLRADPLTQMNKVSEWFEQKRVEKDREEMKMLQRANSCIAALPGLFPDDIAVPRNSSKQAKRTSEPIERYKSAAGDKSHNLFLQSQSKLPRLSDKTCVNPGVSDYESEAVRMAKQMEMDRLRAERLQRERKERERAALVMAKAMGLSEALRDPATSDVPTDEREIPFNSAFNPELSAALAERRRRHRESRKRPRPSI